MRLLFSIFWALVFIAIFILQWKGFMIRYKQESENLDGEFRLLPKKNDRVPTSKDLEAKKLSWTISLLIALLILSFIVYTYINLTAP